MSLEPPTIAHTEAKAATKKNPPIIFALYTSTVSTTKIEITTETDFISTLSVIFRRSVELYIGPKRRSPRS